MMKYILVVLLSLHAGAVAARGCSVDISGYVGWKIIQSGTITGYIDDNGMKTIGFKGCQRNRVLIIDNADYITCNEYGSLYLHRPTIVILSKGYEQRACIGNRMFRIKK